jgi:hypothetical protein
MTFEVGAHLRRAAPGEIRRRGADDPLQVGDLAMDKRAFRDVSRAHSDVGLFVDQIDQPIGDRQIDVDFRIAREKIGERRSKLMQTKSRARIDAQFAARRAAHPRDLGLRLLDIGNDAAGTGQKRLAFRRQRQPAGAPLQELNAQTVLKARYQLGNRRRRYP